MYPKYKECFKTRQFRKLILLLPSNYLFLEVKCILEHVYSAEKKVTHRDKEEPNEIHSNNTKSGCH